MVNQLKKQLLDFCLEFVQTKQTILQESLSDAKNSLDAETQSTAGDKHDTSRAMMHLEIEKKSKQLSEIDKLKRVLTQIKPSVGKGIVGLGSIIETDIGTYYIAINAGKKIIDGKEYIAISLASPLAQHLKSSPINSTLNVMGRSYEILKIY